MIAMLPRTAVLAGLLTIARLPIAVRQAILLIDVSKIPTGSTDALFSRISAIQNLCVVPKPIGKTYKVEISTPVAVCGRKDTNRT